MPALVGALSIGTARRPTHSGRASARTRPISQYFELDRIGAYHPLLYNLRHDDSFCRAWLVMHRCPGQFQPAACFTFDHIAVLGGPVSVSDLVGFDHFDKFQISVWNGLSPDADSDLYRPPPAPFYELRQLQGPQGRRRRSQGDLRQKNRHHCKADSRRGSLPSMSPSRTRSTIRSPQVS